jgi:hypothetical protein
MQRKRLAQTEKLIEQYSKLVQDSAIGGMFAVALERAIRRKQKLESWLGAHKNGPNPADSFGQFPIE